MYKFPLKLKIVSIALMILGLGLTVVSFLLAPKNEKEVEQILNEQEAHGHHSSKNHDSGHTKDIHFDLDKVPTDIHHVKSISDSTLSDHKKITKHITALNSSSDTLDIVHDDVPKQDTVSENIISRSKVIVNHSNSSHDSIVEPVKDTVLISSDSKNAGKGHINTESHRSIDKSSKISNFIVNTYNKDSDLKTYVAPPNKTDSFIIDNNSTHTVAHSVSELSVTDHDVSHVDPHTEHENHVKHIKHVFHQLTNRPAASFYVALIFFLGVTLLVMAFYAGQRIAQSGWSVVLFRVFEAITANLHYTSIVMLFFIIGTTLHKFHLFPWMADGVLDPQHPNYDSIIYGKKWWMNIPDWTIRSVSYLVVWNVLRLIIRKMSIKQDNGDLKLHKRLFNMSVVFLATFMITESMMSWDWIMGIDPHWFSTLFGWYVLASFLVCALTVTAIVTIYLRSKGALPLVNDSHIHDLAKFMFGFSVFWTYLWFAQFMLVWYADMPEETTYYLQRFNDYKVLFGSMVVMNFIFPVLILLNSDFKSIPWFVVLAGIIILCGHYLDFYVMIMPGTVGSQYGFGFGEIGGILFFTGMFIFATFNSFTKADPVAKGSPFLHESETFHYYIIEHRGDDNNDH